MNILIAPDSYKNNMKSEVVIERITEGLEKALPDAELVGIPMADGGEGTAEALIDATGGERIEVEVSGPLGAPATAFYGISADGKTAFCEMASASGIELVPSGQLNPLLATTFGTGELIKAILERGGVEEIVIGIGGSATVDGGAGMAQALGFKLLDEENQEIPRGGAGLVKMRQIDATQTHPGLKNTRIRVACDVTNPLLGPQGAAAIYGPQKGATPEMLPQLEEGLRTLGETWKKTGFAEDVLQPGDGAAGGLGAGLRAFCQAEITSGAALVAEVSGFNKAIKNADVLITGEGKTDGQTASGKLCAVLAEKARKQGIPVILLSGALGGDPSPLLDTFTAAFSISSGHNSLKDSIKHSPKDLIHTAECVGRLLALKG